MNLSFIEFIESAACTELADGGVRYAVGDALGGVWWSWKPGRGYYWGGWGTCALLVNYVPRVKESTDLVSAAEAAHQHHCLHARVESGIPVVHLASEGGDGSYEAVSEASAASERALEHAEGAVSDAPASDGEDGTFRMLQALDRAISVVKTLALNAQAKASGATRGLDELTERVNALEARDESARTPASESSIPSSLAHKLNLLIEDNVKLTRRVSALEALMRELPLAAAERLGALEGEIASLKERANDQGEQVDGARSYTAKVDHDQTAAHAAIAKRVATLEEQAKLAASGRRAMKATAKGTAHLVDELAERVEALERAAEVNAGTIRSNSETAGSAAGILYGHGQRLEALEQATRPILYHEDSGTIAEELRRLDEREYSNSKWNQIALNRIDALEQTFTEHGHEV